MRDLLLSLCSAALIGIAGYVMAQTAAQEKPPGEATSAAATSAAEADRDTRLRLARMDTSAAAFRKLDKDNDGRISPLEAADNPKLAAAFTMADRDKDGYLSKEEFEALGSTAAHPSSDEDASSPSGDRASEPQQRDESAGHRPAVATPRNAAPAEPTQSPPPAAPPPHR
jgi:EF hand